MADTETTQSPAKFKPGTHVQFSYESGRQLLRSGLSKPVVYTIFASYQRHGEWLYNLHGGIWAFESELEAPTR